MFNELISSITDVDVLKDSFYEWISTLSINKVIIFIMMIFMLM